MNSQEPINPHAQTYPAGQVEPGWQLFVNQQWVDIGVVIETETTDGARYITFVFNEDTQLPAVKLRKEAAVTARPPSIPPVA